MSEYQNKSEIYQAAAKLLKKECHYPAVPHCAYYSCYLLIEHIWYNVMGKNQSDICINKNKNEGSHEYLINQITSKIKEHGRRFEISDSMDFNRKINSLKKLRTRADYKDVSVDYKDSDNSIQLSEEIIPILKKIR